MDGSNDLSYCAGEVRRHDRDRFLTALFAPPERREALFALYAFNLEISKVREVVSEPTIGAIRLQWWRDAIDEIYRNGPVRRHGVSEPLADAIRQHHLTRAHFDRLIDARAFDLDDEPPEDVAGLAGYAEATSSTLVWLALEALGTANSAAAGQAGRAIGVAWSVIGLIRTMPMHLRRGRIYLPRSLSLRHGVDRREMLNLKPSPELEAAVGEMAEFAAERLAEARALRRELPTGGIAALLPGALADGYLGRLRRVRHNVFDPRLAQGPGLQVARLALRASLGRY